MKVATMQSDQRLYITYLLSLAGPDKQLPIILRVNDRFCESNQ